MNLIARCLLLSVLVGLLSSCVPPKDVASEDSTPEEHHQLLHTAERGDAEAQLSLGIKYYFGRDLPKDDVQGRLLAHKSR